MHAGSWRVGDDHVGAAMLLDELIVQNVLHVAGIEERVADMVLLGVHLGVLDGLGYIFYSDHLAGLPGHKVGNGAGAGIEVVDQRLICALGHVGEGKVARHLVELVGLVGVGLIEALGTHLELQPFHLQIDMVVALEDMDGKVAESVVTLLIVDP